jgi:hypothetical protein
MEIIVDGILYVPFTEPAQDKSLLSALDIRFDSDAGNNITVRDYLRSLLETLWYEKDGFSGKRPFGNSGWHYELISPLIKHGYLKGELDEDDCVNSYDSKEANAFVKQLILAMCHGVIGA